MVVFLLGHREINIPVSICSWQSVFDPIPVFNNTKVVRLNELKRNPLDILDSETINQSINHSFYSNSDTFSVIHIGLHNKFTIKKQRRDEKDNVGSY